MFKSGFVAVVGRSNVGKSTLLNHIMKEKLSIVTNRAQTTRKKIKLIYTDDRMQIIFLDTPGIQQPKNKLGEYMLDISESSFNETDLITYIVDSSFEIGSNEKYIIERLKQINKKIVLLINKIDLISKEQLDAIIKMYQEINLFEEVIPVSAATGKNIDKYLDYLYANMDEGPLYYPDEEITDQSQRSIVSEYIREKALIYLDEEIPHGITVLVEKMKKRDDKDIYDIEATIVVEKKSHKGMVIGKNGKMIRKIGMAARKEIESFLQTKVNLQLWVKVIENWRTNDDTLKHLGFNKNNNGL